MVLTALPRPPLVEGWRMALTPVRMLEDVPRLREWLRVNLSALGLGAILDSAELAFSEVLTNAIVYGQSAQVHVAFAESRLKVWVFDQSPHEPRITPESDGEPSEHGRGLRLVDAFTSRWGYEFPEWGAGAGKRVWFEIDFKQGA